MNKKIILLVSIIFMGAFKTQLNAVTLNFLSPVKNITCEIKKFVSNNPKTFFGMACVAITIPTVAACFYFLNKKNSKIASSEIYEKISEKSDSEKIDSEKSDNINQEKDFLLKLTLACKENNLEKVKDIIGDKSLFYVRENISEFDKENSCCALSWACYYNNFEMIKILVTNGFKAKQEDIDKTTNREIKKYLYLDMYPCYYYYKQEDEIVAPIFTACENGDLKMLKLFLEEEKYKNAVNSSNSCEQTPLIVSNYYQDNFEIMKCLIENGASKSINQADKFGYTPLIWTCKFGKLKNIKLLVSNGATGSINKAGENGNTPLIFALENNNLEIIEYLCENGAIGSINQANEDGKTPLYKALYKCPKIIVNYLIKNGAVDNENITQLHIACRKNNLYLVEKIINSDAIKLINATDRLGSTPLYWACLKGNLRMVKLLISFGASKSINIAGLKNKTPLLLACKNIDIKMVRYLCENGANKSINVADKYGHTPLELACESKNLEIVKCLVENGAEICEDVIGKFHIIDNEICEYLREQLALKK